MKLTYFTFLVDGVMRVGVSAKDKIVAAARVVRDMKPSNLKFIGQDVSAPRFGEKPKPAQRVPALKPSAHKTNHEAAIQQIMRDTGLGRTEASIIAAMEGK